jgi:hypothetical protein
MGLEREVGWASAIQHLVGGVTLGCYTNEP